jgi:anti-sigma-K factor RskA
MSQDLHLLIGPYVLDALEADDRARFEAHLAQCEQCRAELSGFTATAGRLGEAAADTPPADLRDRVVALAATTPQEHPAVTAFVQRRPASRWASRLALAAAVAAAILGIGGFVVEHQRAGELRAERSELVTVMAAPDATTTSRRVTGGGAVRVIASAQHDAAIVVGASLDALDEDHTYQVWRMDDGTPTSVGLLGPGPGVLLVKNIAGADAFAVSVEPSGGSEQPTSTPIVVTPV